MLAGVRSGGHAMSCKNFAVALCVCLLVQGCARQPLSPTQAERFKRVAVISSIGDLFATQQVGIMVFGNEYNAKNISLDVDAMVTADVARVLSAKYQVADLSKYGRQFAEQPKYWPGTKLIIGETRPSAGEVLRGIVGAETYDAYVVIVPGYAQIGTTNQGVGGVGILRAQGLIRDGKCYLHAVYLVTVIDGKDYSIAATMKALSADRFLGLPDGPMEAPNEPIDCRSYQSPDESAPMIKQSLARLLEKTIPETLKDAKLIP
jgi:hypothetical protein